MVGARASTIKVPPASPAAQLVWQLIGAAWKKLFSHIDTGHSYFHETSFDPNCSQL